MLRMAGWLLLGFLIMLLLAPIPSMAGKRPSRELLCFGLIKPVPINRLRDADSVCVLSIIPRHRENAYLYLAFGHLDDSRSGFEVRLLPLTDFMGSVSSRSYKSLLSFKQLDFNVHLGAIGNIEVSDQPILEINFAENTLSWLPTGDTVPIAMIHSPIRVPKDWPYQDACKGALEPRR